VWWRGEGGRKDGRVRGKGERGKGREKGVTEGGKEESVKGYPPKEFLVKALIKVFCDLLYRQSMRNEVSRNPVKCCSTVY